MFFYAKGLQKTRLSTQNVLNFTSCLTKKTPGSDLIQS